MEAFLDYTNWIVPKTSPQQATQAIASVATRSDASDRKLHQSSTIGLANCLLRPLATASDRLRLRLATLAIRFLRRLLATSDTCGELRGTGAIPSVQPSYGRRRSLMPGNSDALLNSSQIRNLTSLFTNCSSLTFFKSAGDAGVADGGGGGRIPINFLGLLKKVLSV